MSSVGEGDCSECTAGMLLIDGGGLHIVFLILISSHRVVIFCTLVHRSLERIVSRVCTRHMHASPMCFGGFMDAGAPDESYCDLRGQ